MSKADKNPFMYANPLLEGSEHNPPLSTQDRKIESPAPAQDRKIESPVPAPAQDRKTEFPVPGLQIKKFFTAAKRRKQALRDELMQLLGRQSAPMSMTKSAVPTLRQKISLQDDFEIFSYLSDNREKILAGLQKNNFIFLITKETSQLNYTIEIVGDIENQELHLFINTKNKLGVRFRNSKGKLQVVKDQSSTIDYDGRTKTPKVIARGGEKEWQYCFHWMADLAEPVIYSQGVLRGDDSLSKAKKEHTVSRQIGGLYAVIGLFGNQRQKHELTSHSYYAEFAQGDLFNWADGTHKTCALRTTPLDQFLFVLYKMSRGLAYIHRLGLILHDIKLDNLLLIDNNGNLDVRYIDFSFVISRDDEKRRCNSGTVAYAAPEYDFLKNLRALKIQHIEALQAKDWPRVNELAKLLSTETARWETRYGKLKAVECILSAWLPSSLKPEEPTQSLFIADAKDDVWSMGVTMALLFQEYSKYTRFKDPELSAIIKSMQTLRVMRPTSEEVLAQIKKHLYRYRGLRPMMDKLDSEESSARSLSVSTSSSSSADSLSSSESLSSFAI